MHQIKDIVNVAAQLMAADIPALGRDLQTQLHFGQPVADYMAEKCDAYVVLADKLLDAVDRWYKKQTAVSGVAGPLCAHPERQTGQRCCQQCKIDAAASPE